jgi:hypothetical protein
MPVEAQTVEYVYLGDGATKVFSFPSKFLSADDIFVGLNGVEQSSGYTASGAGNEYGGTVTFITAPANGVRVSLLRRPPASQLLDFVNGQTVLEGLLDNGLDKLTMIAQYLLRGVSKSVRLSEFDSTALTPLPLAEQRANRFLGFNSSGELITVASLEDLQVPASAASLLFENKSTAAATVVAASVKAFTVAGYTTAGDGGAALYTRLASAPAPVSAWHIQTADGAWWRLDTPVVSPLHFGLAAAVDAAAPWQAAINYAQEFKALLWNPAGNWVLGSGLVVTKPIDIRSSTACQMRWTAGAVGWDFDLRASGADFGLCRAELPGLYSPAIDATWSYPGYPNAWTTAARDATGRAFRLRGGSRMKFVINYIAGWDTAVELASSYDAGNGADAPMNVDCEINTIDLCRVGVSFQGGFDASAAQLAAIAVTINTLFAKFPVWYGASHTSVNQCSVRVTGQVFVNEDGGCGVYGYGSQINGCEVHFNWIYAGKGSDSPVGTPADLSCPWLGGSAASNGTSTDGNTAVGYFQGYANKFRFGYPSLLAGLPGGAPPGNSVATRIRDTGGFNAVSVQGIEHGLGSALTLSQTQGEANFNGGVGGASISRATLVTVTFPQINQFDIYTYYFYHQKMSDGGSRRPVRIATYKDDKHPLLNVNAFDNGDAVNREVKIQLFNITTTPIPAGTYAFWVFVED